MIKAALVGVGFMGRGHLEKYLTLMKENFGVQLVALCDVDPKKFASATMEAGNLGDIGTGAVDFSQFHLYNDFDDMLANEPDLDYVDMALPTFLHSYYACRAMEKGFNVLCEKPMAIDEKRCQAMIDTQKKTGKQLMIAQCLRFWPSYVALKDIVASGELGRPLDAQFYRGGGGIPTASYQNWLRDEYRSGGCLLDQHVHDVDMVNYLFGMPEAVSTVARNIEPGSGYDAVSTHYRYADNLVVNTHGNWTQHTPFGMTYLVQFEKGTVASDGGKVTVYYADGTKKEVELADGDGYLNEIKYYVTCLREGKPIVTCTPESAMNTIHLARTEMRSADANGEWIAL